MGGAIKADLNRALTTQPATYKVATATLALTEINHVEVTPTVAMTLTLPDCGSAAGMFCYIHVNAAYAVTVTGKGLETDLTPTADDDEALLYSTGFRWVPIHYIVSGLLYPII